MNCYKHTDVAAVAFCRTCGRPLCQACQRPVHGTIVCEEHAPRPVVTPPQPQSHGAAPPRQSGSGSPALAFLLSFFFGVGAIYNGQYAKNIIHIVIFGTLITIVSSGAAEGLEPLFGLLIAVWWFYMAFEAYHTARKRQLGLVPDEFSSIFPLRSARRGGTVAPFVLIGLGVLFFLSTMDILHFRDIARFWPLLLIGLGAYMLYSRMSGPDDAFPGQGGSDARR
jgi:hypothetical protein